MGKQDRDSNDFKTTSASDFLKKTRAAEIELKNKANEDSGKAVSIGFNKPTGILAPKKGSGKRGLFDLE